MRLPVRKAHGNNVKLCYLIRFYATGGALRGMSECDTLMILPCAGLIRYCVSVFSGASLKFPASFIKTLSISF